jgi:hypothetical protein
MHSEFSHTITVDYPAEEAIHLFTPKGEESWVPGWTPTYISPECSETSEEMLFLTGHDDETTYWTCMKWEPKLGHARYLRLTPGSRVGFVDVRCQALDTQKTSVRVSYRMHALSSVGEAQLAKMTQDSFNEMIDEWARLIAGMKV